MTTSIDSIMSRRDSYENPKVLTEYLARQLKAGRLALILGAGVSVPFGLPDWTKLVNRMFAEQNSAVPPGPPQRAAEEFRMRYYKRDDPGYLAAVKQALYKEIKIDRWALRNNKTLSAVAAIATAGSRGSISNVVTFNFDDLLEFYLEQHGIPAIKIVEATHWAVNGNIRIYHPHGVLAIGSRPGSSQKIVLDQLSMTQWSGDDSHAWRAELHEVFRSHTCILIGLSGNDEHLDLLVAGRQADHIAIREGLPYWAITFGIEDKDRDRWGERKVWMVGIDSYDDVPDFLFNICALVGASDNEFVSQ